MNFIIVRKPFVDEAEAINALMRAHADKGVLLQRDVDEIRNAIDTFIVAELNEKVIGAVSRYDYGQGLIEVRSLVVDDEHGKGGIGSVLVKNLIRVLLRDGAKKIFALSYSPDFFKKNGFIEVPKETLPEKIWKDCRFCKDRDNCGETALVYKI
ncbi:MAG: GNAT family N-acetyltransferase [Spirochaetia bacterium]|jgi:amino-acid N-acetyltransferase|nr:GNAT family N-acetyltransferase [Spirochaetia bacterium]